MKLNELKKKRKALSLDTQYGKVNIEYCPVEYTGEVERILAEGKDRPIAALVELLGRVLRQWDIEDDDGQPLPVTEEILMKLPVDLLAVITEKITEDMRPKAVNAPA